MIRVRLADADDALVEVYVVPLQAEGFVRSKASAQCYGNDTTLRSRLSGRNNAAYLFRRERVDAVIWPVNLHAFDTRHRIIGDQIFAVRAALAAGPIENGGNY